MMSFEVTNRSAGASRYAQPEASRYAAVARRSRALPSLAALLTALMLPADSFAGVNLTTGKWRDGRIVWYYNNDQRPASFSDADFLALTAEAFNIWSAGCNITPQYGGTTAVGANGQALAANKVVVGFAHLPANVGGTAGPFSADPQSSYYYFTAGMVQFSSDNTPYNLLPERALAILVHEVGHLLNIGHSDEPRSVMYANPYSAIASAAKPYQLYGDDIATCANLYGGRGVQPTTDYGAIPFTPDARYRLSAGVGYMDSRGGRPIAFGSPEDTWQAVDSNAVDLSQMENAPWMRIVWDNPPYDLASMRIIAPTGDIVFDNWVLRTGPTSTIPQGYQPVRSYMWLNGLWKMQVSVNGQPAAETRFTTVNGLSSPPKLEIAAIAESNGLSSMTFRIANYSRVGIVAASAYLNGDYATTTQRVAQSAGSNLIELWAQSNLPRYRAGSGCGQPGASSDLARRVAFSADASGRIVSSAIDVSETGTLIAYSAKGNIQASDTGSLNVYVAAQVGSTLYFRQPDGTWGTTQASLFNFTGPGAANFDILRDFDTRDLPRGTTLYVGYGDTLNQMLANRRYKAVRTF